MNAIAIARASLEKALIEATENVAYWNRQAAIQEEPAKKAQAKALLSAWQTTLSARRAEYNKAWK
jgi:hypothetical protein